MALCGPVRLNLDRPHMERHAQLNGPSHLTPDELEPALDEVHGERSSPCRCPEQVAALAARGRHQSSWDALQVPLGQQEHGDYDQGQGREQVAQVKRHLTQLPASAWERGGALSPPALGLR